MNIVPIAPSRIYIYMLRTCRCRCRSWSYTEGQTRWRTRRWASCCTDRRRAMTRRSSYTRACGTPSPPASRPTTSTQFSKTSSPGSTTDHPIRTSRSCCRRWSRRPGTTTSIITSSTAATNSCLLAILLHRTNHSIWWCMDTHDMSVIHTRLNY